MSTDREKALAERRKTQIQDKLRASLGILVDAPKQGFGSTNDGNTARKFFANVDIVSEVTGLCYFKKLFNT